MEHWETTIKIADIEIIRQRKGKVKEENIMDDYFVTVFPKDECELPQDFSSYTEAKEWADEEFGEGNYTIESPF